ncbi:MAG: LCP family protein, partial [Erysipelotrichaceae bacterium]|nr:LCP family protein [Erysipelotrichaceae bacterium]
MSKQAKRTLNPVIAKNLNLINTVLLVIVDICFMLIANGLNRYSSLSKGLFIGINVGILLVLLLLNFAVIVTIKLRKRTYRLACLCVLPVLLIVGIYGIYAVRVVNTNVDKITRTESEVVEESVEASVVTYNSSISSVSQLEGKIVGYAPNANVGILGKEKLEGEDVTVSWQEYNDSNAVMIALIGGEIDAAILPMNYMSMFANEQGISQYLDSTTALTSYDGSVKTETTTTAGADKDLTSEPFTVLLVGTADGLSDAIMLCSVNPISMNVTITSIARDSWVPIACYAGGESKINSARASGMGCLINTVQNLTGIEIDYYVDTNFQGVVEVVDALGGILVDNPYEFVGQNASSERGHFTVYVPAGENVVLSGEQALAFARERHLYASGDFQRQANQQQVINGMLQKVLRTKNVNTALNVLKAAGDNISTNFTLDQIMEFFNYIMKKGNRYYDDAHIENVLNMQGSRYTGYNSSVWNESAQLALSIVRVYEGSIADNKKAINRNLDLNSAITAQKYIKWDATWDFLAPTISNEVYSEKIIQSETPESYYCQVTGGTWDGSSCSCPGGGEYVAQSGCKVDSATNYADGGSCVVAGFKWNESTNTCMNACPVGTVDNNGYCQGQTADETFEVRFVLCNGTVITENVKKGESAVYPVDKKINWDANTWNNIQASVTFKETGCSTTPDETTEEGCKTAGKYWYNNTCNANPQQTPEEACKASNKYWYNNTCNDNPEQTPEQACTASGKYWYNNTCNDNPQQT